MNIPPKYEDVVAKLDAALGREAALREELALITAAFDELASCVGFSEARLDQTGDSPIDCANQLQRRLTVSEQRAGKMEELLREAYEAGDHNIFGTDLDSRIDAELKPAAEGEGS